MTRKAHGVVPEAAPTVVGMQLITPPYAQRSIGPMLTGTLLGGGFVAAGLSLAFVAMEAPLISGIVPGYRTNSLHLFIAWLALIAGGALLVAGTNRLAAIAAGARSDRRPRSPVVAALGSLPPDVVVATQVVPGDGRPVPELVIGPFGIAVIHELGRRDVMRQNGTSWEVKTRDGWVLTDHPLDRAERDAERVRYWLTHGDLDFIVRVHAALITADASMMRSPLCAVITEAQIPAWIAALPRQRSLTDGRRQQLVARVRAAVTTGSQRGGR